MNEPEETDQSSSINEPEEIDQSNSINEPKEEPALCYAPHFAQARRREELMRRITGCSETGSEEDEPLPGLNIIAKRSPDEKPAVEVKEERLGTGALV